MVYTESLKSLRVIPELKRKRQHELQFNPTTDLARSMEETHSLEQKRLESW